MSLRCFQTFRYWKESRQMDMNQVSPKGQEWVYSRKNGRKMYDLTKSCRLVGKAGNMVETGKLARKRTIENKHRANLEVSLRAFQAFYRGDGNQPRRIPEGNKNDADDEEPVGCSCARNAVNCTANTWLKQHSIDGTVRRTERRNQEGAHEAPAFANVSRGNRARVKSDE